MPKTVKSKVPGDHRGNTAYPVRLDPEDRANLERLHDSIEGVSRTTLLKALLRMSMGAALAEPEVLARHVLRPKTAGGWVMSLMMIGELSVRSLTEEEIDKDRVESVAKDGLYRATIEALGARHPRERAHVAGVFRITSYGENSTGAPKEFVWDLIEAFERNMPGLLDWVMITIHPSESCSQTCPMGA